MEKSELTKAKWIFYSRSYKSYCIRDKSLFEDESLSKLSGMLPGTLYNADRQCQQQYGVIAKNCKKFKVRGYGLFLVLLWYTRISFISNLTVVILPKLPKNKKRMNWTTQRYQTWLFSGLVPSFLVPLKGWPKRGSFQETDHLLRLNFFCLKIQQFLSSCFPLT